MVRTRRKGFTLIELIIAITILALLAVGLLAALDPAEQFNKARDTSTREIAKEISGAIERFYAAQVTYPGAAASGTVGFPGTGTGPVAKSVIMTATSGLSGEAILNALINTGELKANFKVAAGAALSKILVYRDTANNSVFICYKPLSKQFKTQSGLYTAMSTAGTPAATNVALAEGMSVSSATGLTGNCTLAQAGSITDRDYCAFCFQQ